MARNFVQLLSVEYLFDRGLVDLNCDTKLLNNHIITAQEIQIQSVLGNSLYVKVMDLVYDNTISGTYLELLRDWITPALAYWSLYTVIPYLNYKFSNKNVSELTSTNVTPTDLGTIKYLRDDVRNKAEFFTQRIREFIVNNQTSLPEYWSETGIDQIHPKKDSYFSGLYLGRGKRNNCCW